MTIFDREHEPPEEDVADAAYKLARAVALFLPVAFFLETFIKPPIARRNKEWQEDVASTLRRLESEKGIRPEDLSDNPVFIDAVLTATQTAVKTSQVQRLQVLQNSIANAGLPGSPDATLQQVFFSLTDRLSDRHLLLLKLFQDPRRWRTAAGQPLQSRMGDRAVRTMVEEAFPDAIEERDLYDYLWSELAMAKLVRPDTIDNGLEGEALDVKRVTALGHQYLAFITSPF